MKLAANVSLLYPGPLHDRLRLAAEHGFTAVEILDPYDTPAQTLAQHLDDLGIQLVLVNTPAGPAGERGLGCLPDHRHAFHDGLQQAFQVCEATGCRTVHVMAGIVPPAMTHDTARDTLLENLRSALDAAASRGITLTLEALNRQDMPGYFYWHPAQVMDIVETLNHESLGVQFDLYHTQKESLDLRDMLQTVWPRLRHVQFAGRHGRHEPDLLDENVRKCLLALKAQGYRGWIGCEYRPAGDALQGLGWRADYHALLGDDGFI